MFGVETEIYTKLQTMLKELLLLTEALQPPGKTKEQLAKVVGKSVRTVERYFKDLEKGGLIIANDYAGRWFTFEIVNRGNKVFLTHEESVFLSDLLNQAVPNHPLTTLLQTKLFFKAGLSKWAKNKITQNIPQVIESISIAMKINQKIQIQDYYSASSGLTLFREVEPLFFTENYKYLIAFEPSEDKFVNIKTDRIAEVNVLEEKCSKLPDYAITDIFQIASNGECFPVKLLLTSLAFRLLVEEHPSTQDCISPSEDAAFPFCFEARVYNFLPIGRFYLGLPGHLKIVDSEEFRNYIEKKKLEYL